MHNFRRVGHFCGDTCAVCESYMHIHLDKKGFASPHMAPVKKCVVQGSRILDPDSKACDVFINKFKEIEDDKQKRFG